ncbi:hypothetical protein RSOLAG1IB_12052 [Rhizoctonia solani AG-1 IB]|uniref:Uncharacterized protein n=1 Tax=Thanatephorus cucumeris (strain AG1-IB / isolate 7/3/14) TaxID=1108050 RepID=A0A0B7FL62_THACB|nr:hypothetical protein RSOLAG1IB_12052 [Rhizoctonia solani AG-1 IB]
MPLEQNSTARGLPRFANVGGTIFNSKGQLSAVRRYRNIRDILCALVSQAEYTLASRRIIYVNAAVDLPGGYEGQPSPIKRCSCWLYQSSRPGPIYS